MGVRVFVLSLLITLGESCAPGEFYDCSTSACGTTLSEKICLAGGNLVPGVDVIQASLMHCGNSRACRITSPGQYSCDCPETQALLGVCGCSSNYGPSCTKCPAGKFSDATTLMFGGCGCVTCSAGKSSSPGSSSCIPLCENVAIAVNSTAMLDNMQNRTCFSGGQSRKAWALITLCTHFLLVTTIVSSSTH
jgi:hypothetical protein